MSINEQSITGSPFLTNRGLTWLVGQCQRRKAHLLEQRAALARQLNAETKETEFTCLWFVRLDEVDRDLAWIEASLTNLETERIARNRLSLPTGPFIPIGGSPPPVPAGVAGPAASIFAANQRACELAVGGAR